nr:peptide-methionine (S)-S-oxide reductase MsrA [Candidatus Acidoferrales bacterium]
MEKATFAEGCFWGVEANFQSVPGVISAVSGYTGGKTENPSYEDVCSGRTGHAEAVEVEFDPAKVSYEDLLKVFWTSHDPTTPNRQGPDVGTQYRSAIFFHGATQEAAARASKEALEKSGKLKRPIVTEIVAAGPFYRAEEYHQKYFAKHGLHGCGI